MKGTSMKRNVKMIIAATFALGVSVALADKLSDFRDAVGKTGCDSIPYGDLQSNCSSEQSRVHEYCDGSRGPVSCGSENITRQLKENLDRERRGLEALKERKAKLEAEKLLAEPVTDMDLVDAAAAAMEASVSKWQSERASGRMSMVQAATYGGTGTMQLYVTLKDTSTKFIATYKGGEAKLAAAEAALDRLLSSASAPGQADDAKVLTAQMKAELGKLTTAYQAAVTTFTSQHDDNVRNLKDKVACTAEWKALQSKVRSESAISQLSEWRRQTDSYFGVDLKTFRDHVQRRIGSRMSAVATAFEREAAAEAEDQRLVDEGVRQAERF